MNKRAGRETVNKRRWRGCNSRKKLPAVGSPHVTVAHGCSYALIALDHSCCAKYIVLKTLSRNGYGSIEWITTTTTMDDVADDDDDADDEMVMLTMKMAFLGCFG